MSDAPIAKGAIPVSAWGPDLVPFYQRRHEARPADPHKTNARFHHTVTTPPTTVSEEYRAMRQLHDIGVSRFGSGVSYAYLIMPSGRVYQGMRSDTKQTQSGHSYTANYRELGVAFVGNYQDAPLTSAQIAAASRLMATEHLAGRLDSLTAFWHKQVYATACPGDQAIEKMPVIEAGAKREVAAAKVDRDKNRRELVLKAQVFGDVIDVDSNHRRVFDALPDKDDNEVKIIVLGDLVDKNSPLRLWVNEWAPTYGSLPTCKVWSVLGNHGWGWDARGRLDAAHGRNYWRFRRAFHEECTRDVPHPKYCWMKTRPGWLLLGLDSEHPRKSRRFLNRMVRQHGKGRKVVVFIHRAPILPPGSKAPKFKGQRLKRDIHRHADLVMSGHSHRFWRKKVGGTQYIVAGTGEGKGWANLRLFSDGEYRVNFTRL